MLILGLDAGRSTLDDFGGGRDAWLHAMRVWHCLAWDLRAASARSPDRLGDRLARRMRAHALSPWLFRALLPPHSAPHRGVQTDGTPRRVSTMREPHCDH